MHGDVPLVVDAEVADAPAVDVVQLAGVVNGPGHSRPCGGRRVSVPAARGRKMTDRWGACNGREMEGWGWR